MRKCSRKSQEESGGSGTEKEENPARVRNWAKSHLAQLQLISAEKVWEVPPSDKGVGELIPPLLSVLLKGCPRECPLPGLIALGTFRQSEFWWSEGRRSDREAAAATGRESTPKTDASTWTEAACCQHLSYWILSLKLSMKASWGFIQVCPLWTALPPALCTAVFFSQREPLLHFYLLQSPLSGGGGLRLNEVPSAQLYLSHTSCSHGLLALLVCLFAGFPSVPWPHPSKVYT